MTLDPGFDAARRIADAVLYEGYVLYPYRASAQKNQLRWQFGVLVPPAYAEQDPSESSAARTECLLESPPDSGLDVLVRFLQVQRRSVEALGESGMQPVDVLEIDGLPVVPWDEAVEREVRAEFAIADLLAGEREHPFTFPADEHIKPVHSGDQEFAAGQVTRRRGSLDGVVRASAERPEGPFGVLRLAVSVENTWSGSPAPHSRDDALRHSLVSTHTIIRAVGGSFLSMTDPPEWSRPFIDACCNKGTWPVLVGPPTQVDTILSSPIILSDRPQLAPESTGNLYDGTEIDEILTLRTLALTDAERLEVKGTDPRAAAVLDHVDMIPAEMMERLHGTIRYLKSVSGEESPVELGLPQESGVPWWDPGADTSVSPATDEVVIDGVAVMRGSRVRLAPGRRRADAQDIFLAGRKAIVEAVLLDVDGRQHLAVTLDDDEAADLQRAEGRFLYFAPDEVRPLERLP